MMMRFLLVGMHFHPPSKLILDHYLAGGTEVVLEAEPDNPYDAGAVRVLVSKAELHFADGDEHSAFVDAIEGYGLTPETLSDPIMLGHLAASGGKPLARAQEISPGLHGNADAAGATSGRLLFGGNGQILIEVGEALDILTD